MSPLAPLWAQGVGDLIGIALVILFIVIPAIAQVVAKLRQAQQPGGGPQPPQPGARPQPRRPAGGVEEEIGEFLRRVVQGRAGQPAAAPAQQPRPGQPPVMAEPVGQQPVEAEIVQPRPVGGQMKRQVEEYLNTGNFDRRASQFGDEVAQADEQLQHRLHEKFDHEVGRLAGIPGESADVPRVEETAAPEDRLTEMPPTAAAGLAAMLGTAETVRQAILINEILGRPEDRWT